MLSCIMEYVYILNVTLCCWFGRMVVKVIQKTRKNKKKPELLQILLDVPREGLEPSRPYRHQILSLACLPIPSSRHNGFYIYLVVSIYENPSKNQLILSVDYLHIMWWLFFIVFLSKYVGWNWPYSYYRNGRLLLHDNLIESWIWTK